MLTIEQQAESTIDVVLFGHVTPDGFREKLVSAVSDLIRITASERDALARELFSGVADIVRRIGLGATPEWVRGELERLLGGTKFADLAPKG